MSTLTRTFLALATTTVALYLCYAVLLGLPMWLNFLAPGFLIIASLWFCKKTLS